VTSSIFGLQIEERRFEDVSTEILVRTQKGDRLMVVTPNVDHFLRWQESEDFRNLYSFSDYCLVDGMPLIWLARILRNIRVQRITGVDLSHHLLSKANEYDLPIAIIGGTAAVLEKASKNIEKTFPSIDLFLTESPSAEELVNEKYLELLSSNLGKRDKKIVLLCLGSPKQETLYLDLNKINSQSGTYLCVGATVDFLAGEKKRAPKLLQSIGLEWAFRFFQEPKRLFRRYFIDNSRVLKYFISALRLRVKTRHKA
jgi:N-acetylglucosaminyldiphosphoundecaprenol N-acetyl-beta-D-mannosaminyltransferase